MGYTLEFFDDPAKFLSVAGRRLEANPVESTVVASVTARLQRHGLPADPPAPIWWLVVRDPAGEVAGTAMRTAPHPPYPVYLLAMPDEAVRELARTLHERGEQVSALNGALPAVEVCAAELARLTGGEVVPAEQMRLHQLGEPAMPPKPEGRLRIATAGDLDLVIEWFNAFGAAAAEQAGRHEPHASPIETRESALRRIEGGEVWLWESPDGEPANVTAFNPPGFGVARVGPVYTPPDHRGHGYAAAAVAAVSAMLLGQGARVCLFTDVANTVSNELYARLGYRPVVDMANLVIEPGARQDGERDPARS